MKSNDTSRREFITTALLGSAVLAGCSTGNNPFEPDKSAMLVASGEKVKLLSVTGEVIEIDKAF